MARRGYYKEGTQTRITGSDSYVSFAASDKGKADRAWNAMRKIYGMGSGGKGWTGKPGTWRTGSRYAGGAQIYGIPSRRTGRRR